MNKGSAINTKTRSTSPTITNLETFLCIFIYVIGKKKKTPPYRYIYYKNDCITMNNVVGVAYTTLCFCAAGAFIK